MPSHRTKKAQRCESAPSSPQTITTVPNSYDELQGLPQLGPSSFSFDIMQLAPRQPPVGVGGWGARYATPQRQILHELKQTSPKLAANRAEFLFNNPNGMSNLLTALPFEDEHRMDSQQHCLSHGGNPDNQSFTSVPQWSENTASSAACQSEGLNSQNSNHHVKATHFGGPFRSTCGSGGLTSSPSLAPTMSSMGSTSTTSKTFFAAFSTSAVRSPQRGGGGGAPTRVRGKRLANAKRGRRAQSEDDETNERTSQHSGSEGELSEPQKAFAASSISQKGVKEKEGTLPPPALAEPSQSAFCRVIDKPFSNVNPLYVMLKEKHQQRKQSMMAPSSQATVSSSDNNVIPIRTFYQHQRHYDPLRMAPRKGSRSVARPDDDEVVGLCTENQTRGADGNDYEDVEQDFHETPSQFRDDRCGNEDSIMVYYTPTNNDAQSPRCLSVSTMCVPSRDRSLSPPHMTFGFTASNSFQTQALPYQLSHTLGAQQQQQQQQLPRSSHCTVFSAPPPLPPPSIGTKKAVKRVPSTKGVPPPCSPTPKLDIFGDGSSGTSPLTDLLQLTSPTAAAADNSLAQHQSWGGGGVSIGDFPTFGLQRQGRSPLSTSPLGSFPQRLLSVPATTTTTSVSPFSGTSMSVPAAFASPRPANTSTNAHSTRAAFSSLAPVSDGSTILRKNSEDHSSASPRPVPRRGTAVGFQSSFPPAHPLGSKVLQRRLDFTGDDDENDNTNTDGAMKSTPACNTQVGNLPAADAQQQQWQMKQSEFFKVLDKRSLDTV